MQLTQDVVGQVAAGLGLAVDVDRHLFILAAHFANEAAQAVNDGVVVVAGQLFVVDRQDERTGATLLLRKLAQVTITGHPKDLKALILNGLRQGTDAQARRVVGAVILVDDDDGKTEFHAQPLAVGNQ